MTLHAPENVKARIRETRRLQLFLDYDGTLADFAPTPEHVEPDPEVIGLVKELAEHPRTHVKVISGRRLNHVERLLPVPDVLLAGTYGIELRLPDGKRVHRVRYDKIRPVLEAIKPPWERLIIDRDGFFLEDKDWALAIHARYAADDEAEEVLEEAREIARSSIQEAVNSDSFRILGGHKFLEVGPVLAHKGRTVQHLLDRYPWPDALALYIGDDDKDEEAFGVIHAHGGLAIKVCDKPRDTEADGWLESPEEARRWLATLLLRLSDRERSTLDE